ncbi:TBC1 domain family member 2A isoform X2 [Heterodontus francisci]|uniref:TBC1 domain family member 2A isoform X2 n=1 Tax=Heterodontus francisci TaxID=7792 RepID=UPI00355C6DB8
MADEFEVSKTDQTETFKPVANSAIQAECESVNEETLPENPDDLANYLQSKPPNEERVLPKKLCGYLNKLGGKGPLKGCKTRWFVYDQKTCHLYYFRTAQDSNPLGSMDLSRAAFNYCLEAEEGTFEIITPDKEYVLKAKNRDAMMYWLQQLQQKRWEHGEEKNHHLIDDLTISTEHHESPPAFKTEVKEEQKTPFQKCSQSSLKSLTNRLNSNPLSPEKLTVKDGIAPDKATRAHDDILSLTNELNAQRELVKLLHRALEAAQQEKRACNSYLSADESTRLELVRHKVRQIRDLDNRVCVLEKEKQELEQSLRLQSDLVEELKQHAQLLMEKNHAKQEVILKLSEQMANESTSLPEACDKVIAEMMSKLEEKIVHLKDGQEAYKTQNKFLNSEIYQMTKLWQDATDREKTLAMKCAYLEAKYCQIESKYLIILHKLQDNNSNQEETHQEMVKQLIADQLRWEIKAEPVNEFGRVCNEYDEYGFKTVSSPVQDKNLLARIQALQRKSNLIACREGQERAILVKWANHLSGRTYGELVPTPELKNLIRNGIPKEHRRHVWKWCTDRRVRHIRERYGSKRYQELLKLCKNKQQAASKQIELDLHRTLTDNRLFTSPTSKMVQKLRRVLLAYSWQNPDIGYCQGLNRLVAIALLILREEEDAFWCLVAIIDCIMPEDYYSKNLTGSQVDQRVFKDFLSEKLPRLMSHFEQYNVDLSYVTFNWFLVVFVDSLQSNILLRIWDAFLYEGTKVIFRYALAIFKYNEEEILKLNDNLAIYEYLRCLTKNISEGRKLMNIAFVEMNPFPLRLLQNRRATHLEKLNAELSELERIREAYVKERVEQKDRIDGISEDEEETERNRPAAPLPEFSASDTSES